MTPEVVRVFGEPQPEKIVLRNPITTEIQYSLEELDFIKAMELYRRENCRPFPTCREVLAIVRTLGYRKVAAAEPLPTFKRNKKKEIERCTTMIDSEDRS